MNVFDVIDNLQKTFPEVKDLIIKIKNYVALKEETSISGPQSQNVRIDATRFCKRESTFPFANIYCQGLDETLKDIDELCLEITADTADHEDYLELEQYKRELTTYYSNIQINKDFKDSIMPIFNMVADGTVAVS